VKHRATRRFWKCFQRLPDSVKEVAREKFELLEKDPNHPSLHFKEIGVFWSVRITLFYRALAIKDGEDLVWVWIGTHEDYGRMLKSSA